MRLGSFSILAVIIGLTLSACGGESVEDRARALKAAAQKSAPPQADASTPVATAPASSGSAAPATPPASAP